MKKRYIKPLVSVEELSLNQPIAATCNAEKHVIESLVQMGYFGTEEDSGCSFYLLPDGGVDEDFDGVADSYDTICYNSNIQTAFLS